MTGVQTCARSEEHTSELQSHDNLVCRLLLEKKKKTGTGRIGRHSEGHAHSSAHARAPAPRLYPQPRCHCRAGSHPSSDPVLFFFFFNDTAPPKISPFPLPAALPI